MSNSYPYMDDERRQNANDEEKQESVIIVFFFSSFFYIRLLQQTSKIERKKIFLCMNNDFNRKLFYYLIQYSYSSLMYVLSRIQFIHFDKNASVYSNIYKIGK